jgi:hypothetical protein
MNILVIGNGFDLEHGLPTKYKDFLDFMQCINFLKEDLNSTNNTTINEIYFGAQLEEQLNITLDNNVKKYFCDKNLLDFSEFNKWAKDGVANKLVEYAGNNIWIKYFVENIKYKNQGWIDFETEISNVIQCFDYMKNYSEYCKKYLKWPEEKEQEKYYKEEIVKKILVYSMLDIKPFELIEQKLELIIETLNEHLNNLIICLEIYLEDCVENIQAKYLASDLVNYMPNKVLSFNYTKTHEKYYKCEKNLPTNNQGQLVQPKTYEYIHGQAMLGREKENNNMVIGIDEYLDKDKKDKELDFIEFKKYYQRIYKRTGLEYSKWIDYVCSNNFSNEIYIFGHSLDVTDKDILYKLLIESNRKGNYNTKITIFFHNKKAYAQQIANVIKIIGQDELIKRVSGANPTIIFKQQQQRIERV